MASISDGGQNWHEYHLTDYQTDVAVMATKNTWYAAGENGAILKSISGGTTSVEHITFAGSSPKRFSLSQN